MDDQRAILKCMTKMGVRVDAELNLDPVCASTFSVTTRSSRLLPAATASTVAAKSNDISGFGVARQPRVDSDQDLTVVAGIRPSAALRPSTTATCVGSPSRGGGTAGPITMRASSNASKTRDK
jgi:hypothetical protein